MCIAFNISDFLFTTAYRKGNESSRNIYIRPVCKAFDNKLWAYAACCCCIRLQITANHRVILQYFFLIILLLL